MAIPFNLKLGTHRIAKLEDFKVGLEYEVVYTDRNPIYGVPHVVGEGTFVNDAREFYHFVNHAQAYISLENEQSKQHKAIVEEIKGSKVYEDLMKKDEPKKEDDAAKESTDEQNSTKT